jgi:hypothetical protein
VWKHWGLGRIDGINAEGNIPTGREAVIGSKSFPEFLQETIIEGERKISDANGCRIAAAASASDGDDGNCFLSSADDEKGFVLQRVNRVDEVVIASGEKFIGAGGSKELFDGVNVAFRVYSLHPGFHHLDLGFADFEGECRELAIDVADANFIQIDQGQSADSSAGQSFDGPGTDTTNTEDANVRAAQTVLSGNSDEPSDSAEPNVVITGKTFHFQAIYPGFAK